MNAKKKTLRLWIAATALLCVGCISFVTYDYRQWHGRIQAIQWEAGVAEDYLRNLEAGRIQDPDRKQNLCTALRDDLRRYSLARRVFPWKETAVRDDIEHALNQCREEQSSAPESIGVATMNADGSIVLRLRATTPGGGIGEAQMVYPRNHKNYAEVLNHLGGLKPGESKPVPPWPDNP